jgi:DNA integrity scanning protein DisA with diadenylate cyclase activity
VKEDRLLDVEEFGMRHRSAIRLVAAAPDVVAFVVSRDGSVNMIFGQDGRVTFHRDVPLVRGVV